MAPRIRVEHPRNCIATSDECFPNGVTISELSYFLPYAAANEFCNKLQAEAELWVNKPPKDSNAGTSRCNSICPYRSDIKL